MKNFNKICLIITMVLVLSNAHNAKLSGTSTSDTDTTKSAVTQSGDTIPNASPMAPGFATKERPTIAAPQKTGPTPWLRKIQPTRYSMINETTFVSDWNLKSMKDPSRTEQDQSSFIFSATVDKDFTIVLAPQNDIQVKELKSYYFLKFNKKEISLNKKDGKKTKKLLTVKQKDQLINSKDIRTDGPPSNMKNYWIKIENNKITFGFGNVAGNNEAGSYEEKDGIKTELTVGFSGSSITLSVMPRLMPKKMDEDDGRRY